MQFITLPVICFISVLMISVSGDWALAAKGAASGSRSATEPVTTEASLDFYSSRVQPLFDNRCLACHSCFNAPCQLNLQSYDGFLRGANKLNVYDGTRTKAVSPTRIWVDAKTEKEWRRKAFYEVHTSDNPEKNLFFQMLRLRASNPELSVSKQVHESQVCAASLSEFKALEKNSPELGMPYGLPPLTSEELSVLETWVRKGAPGPGKAARANEFSEETRRQIREWEGFLNQEDLRHKLVSRYLYEHLFLAHIHFGKKPREFFRLIRSSRACEKGPDEIATRRPNDDPQKEKFFYCLQKFPGTIVEKTHMPYEWSPAKLARYKEIFFSDDWSVKALPSYQNSVAENPFIAFQDIPVKARYQFLLDDAHYEVSTFIKGPVCNGSMAVNSIQEQFYVFFLKPDSDNMVRSPDYNKRASELLLLPGMFGSDVELINTPVFWTKITDHREKYRALRAEEVARVRPKGYALTDIWDGDGVNDNAVLTVFRHDQNAVVMKGAVGDLPKTAFVLDYPLLERLVYNLVVNFDVFGNVSHQLMTRIYMDLIRMEAEELFLSFLPPEQRLSYRRAWYRGLLTTAKMNYIYPTVGSTIPTSIRYTEEGNTKKQFIEKVLFYRLNDKVRGALDTLNWKSLQVPEKIAHKLMAQGTAAELRRVASVPAHENTPFAQFFPDVAYVMIQNTKGGAQVYSLIHQKEHENISWIIAESLRMAPEEDTLSFVEGFWGSYPNMIFSLKESDLKLFVKMIQGIRSEKDYQNLVDAFGVRRQNSKFWSSYDELNKIYRETKPIDFGYLDLTRYDL